MKYHICCRGERNDFDREMGCAGIYEKWLDNSAWLDLYCFLNKGKPFNFTICCCNQYSYKKKGIIPKYVLVGYYNKPHFPDFVLNRRDGIEIKERNEVKKKLDPYYYDSRSHNGEISVNGFIYYDCKVTSKYSLKRYNELYEQIHAHKDTVIQMLQSLRTEPFNESQFVFDIRESYIRLYYDQNNDRFKAMFKKFGMNDIPDGRIDLVFALADLIVELVRSKWLKSTDEENCIVNLVFFHGRTDVRVCFSINRQTQAEPVVKEDPNLKSW